MIVLLCGTAVGRVGPDRGSYLAGYLLRTGDPALTCSRWSTNAAATAEPPTSDRRPMFRLEERSREKLLAMLAKVRCLKKEKRLVCTSAGMKEGQPGGNAADEVPLME